MEIFRPPGPGVPIHPTEKLLIGIVCFHLALLPWALGGMHLWTQLVSLALSLAALAVALLPREYDRALAGGQAAGFRLIPWPKLIKFPVFWLGLGFLLYIAVQALNPAFAYRSDQRGWWIEGVANRKWLPGGVQSPFTTMNAWRMAIIAGSAWLTVCALWIGVTRRRSLEALFTVLTVNAALLAMLGIAQRALEADKILWFWSPPAPYFVSSFIYKNHAGAYFNLLLALGAGCAGWYYARAERRLEKSGPGPVFVFLSAVIGLIVLFSFSRTAAVLLFFFLAVCTGWFVVVQWRKPAGSRSLLVGFMLLVALGSFLYIGFYSLRAKDVMDRMVSAVETYNREDGTDARAEARRATLDLIRARPAFGWGAGSFRFAFPMVQKNHPAILRDVGTGKLLAWDHVHNDYYEFVAEFGWVGVIFPVLILAFWLRAAVRSYLWENPMSGLMLAGCLITLLHCWLDFNFHNPAIFITWCAYWPAMTRWGELLETGTRG